jgi:cell division protein FtsZ
MNTAMNPPSTSPLVIRLVGVGNAGLAMLDALQARALPGVDSLAINTDDPSLHGAPASVKICLEAPTLSGLGTGGDPERGRELAEEQFGRIKVACEGANVVFLLTGLGRGVGSGAAPVVAQAAKEAGALVIAFAALPFQFEGVRRERQAARALERLREFADGVVTWPNEKVFQFINESSPVAETLRTVNARMADGVSGLWRMLTRTGLLDVQFADLCAVLRDGHVAACIASAEAAGESRAAVATEKLLAHPLLEQGSALTQASAVLVGIAAGSNLTMAEVNRVMTEVNSRCGEAKVFVGAAEDTTLGDGLHVTLVVAHGAPEPTEAHEPARGTRPHTHHDSGGGEMEMETGFLDKATAAPRAASRYKAPAPELSPDRMQQLAKRGRGRKASPKLRQEQLPLQLVSKGRFDRVEPTVLDGEDLDVPTFVRRNMVFN